MVLDCMLWSVSFQVKCKAVLTGLPQNAELFQHHVLGAAQCLCSAFKGCLYLA